MKSGGGKTKGGQFERDIARRLSLWLTSNKRNDCLWRSAGSGSMSTNSIKRGGGAKQYQASDLAPNSPEAYLLVDRFTIECKFYANLQLESLLFNPKSKLLVFWRQAQRDAKSVGKQPLLIAKQNNRPIIVGLYSAAAVKLGLTDVRILTIDGLSLIHFEDFLMLPPDRLNRISNETPRPARIRSTLNSKPA